MQMNTPIKKILLNIIPSLLMWISGFFFSMLWFMLMADTLIFTSDAEVLPPATLAMIINFYTVIFGPMTWLVKIVFALGLFTMTAQMFFKEIPKFLSVLIFVTNVPPIFMAALYIIPMVDRLITNTASLEVQTQYVRTVHTAHVIAASCVTLMIILQITVLGRLRISAATHTNS